MLREVDPWGGYSKTTKVQPVTSSSEGLQQLEERISSAVLARLPPNMETDDVPERMSNLETQVKQLMAKHQSLEGPSFHGVFHAEVASSLPLSSNRFSNRTDFPWTVGNQTQSVQAMFEAQMHQIRNLLSKRTTDENPME